MKTTAISLAIVCAFGCGTEKKDSPKESSLNEGWLRSRSHVRITIAGDKLYGISGTYGGGLNVFNVGDARVPEELGQVTADLSDSGDVATLFSDGQYLFVGGDQQTYIYSINNSGIPTKLDALDVTGANNSLIVAGTKAYSINSALRVIDLSEPRYTKTVGVKPMSAANALGVVDDRLFVCNATNGLLELNVADPAAIQEVSTVPDETCSSIAVVDKTLVTIGKTGISRYDLTTPGLLRLSRLP